MYEILETLVRLMAPILSFTADEIWEYMPGSDRGPTVHSELFIPFKEEYLDPEMAARWDVISKVRREVTRSLEKARKDKRIGHSLVGAVTLGVSDDLKGKLDKYKEDLRRIFIVSSVDMVPIEDIDESYACEEMEELRVFVEPTKNPKCERCWVHDPTVGTDDRHPTACQRCVEALDEMESAVE
jgi:isoleucyl-tRNA synthetase